MLTRPANALHVVGQAAPPVLSQPRRGRPAGSRMRVDVHLPRSTQVAFLRALIQGIPLQRAWDQYLGGDGAQATDRRSAAYLRDLLTSIRVAAAARGLEAQANVALCGLEEMAPRALARSQFMVAPAPPAAPVSVAARSLPDLEDWIADRCDELGIDIDFQSQADWLAEYEDAFGARPPGGAPVPTAPPSPALTSTDELLPRRRRRRQDVPAVVTRLAALQVIESAFAVAPKSEDKLSAWLTSDVTKQLEATSVRGVLSPLSTLADVIDFAHEHGPRWWRHVPKLGEVRASRLLAWLAPVAEQHGAIPAEKASLTRIQGDLADGRMTGEPSAQVPEMSRCTRERAEALALEWLERHQPSPHTYASYRLISRRFLDWCAGAGLDAFKLSDADWRAYEAMLASPPKSQIRPAPHLVTAETRSGLCRRALGSSSIALNLRVIAAFLRWAEVQLPAASPANMPTARASGVAADDAEPVDSGALHSLISDCWEQLYRRSGPSGSGTPNRCDQRPIRAASLRRARIVLDLAFHAGLRRSDFFKLDGALAVSDLQPEGTVAAGGGDAHGSGYALPDIHQLISNHRADALASNPSLVEIAGRSVVLPLRPALRGGGRSAMPGEGGQTRGSLQAGSLYQSFKRFLRWCADLLSSVDPAAAAQVKRASIASLRVPAHRGALLRSSKPAARFTVNHASRSS